MDCPPEQQTLEKTHDLLERSRRLLEMLDHKIDGEGHAPRDSEQQNVDQSGQPSTTDVDEKWRKKPR